MVKNHLFIWFWDEFLGKPTIWWVKFLKSLMKLLLFLAEIKGCVVTIDAMGCQENIAKAIVKQEANYILAVKENQKQLYQNIEDEFKFNKAIQTHIQKTSLHFRKKFSVA